MISWWTSNYCTTYVCDVQHISANVETMKVVLHQNVARCRDGESVSKGCLERQRMLTGLLHCHRTPPCSWTFSTSLFLHAATSSIRETIHHPYIATCFCGKYFYSPCYNERTVASASYNYIHRLG